VLSSVRYEAQWTSVLGAGKVEFLMHWREMMPVHPSV
jgi:hypothetical protein